MAEPGNAKTNPYIVPAVAIFAVVALVVVVISVSGASSRKMSDGSDGTASDSGLKEIVPGVRYRDLKVGGGDPCPAGASVTIHYTGWLENGEVFDSTKEDKKTPQSAKFQLKNLIKGWQEGIPGMKAGGIRKLVLSPEKGYGASGSPPKIPGNSTIIFEVELIEFTPPPAPLKLSDGTDPNAPDASLKDIGEGLMIRDIKEGSGEPAKEGATVTIHYVGWLTNGVVFDSSRERNEPATFPLPDLIKGWQKGIPGMKPGGIRKLVVPSALGYKDSGRPPKIPGGATLVFEVELLK